MTVFPTKKAFVDWNKNVFDRISREGGDISDEEQDTLFANFQRYSPKLRAMEPGSIKDRSVSYCRNNVTGSYMFTVESVEGRRIAISRRCRPKSLRERCMKALRGSVVPQILEHSRAGHEVDHIVQFKDIVDDFLRSRDMTLEELERHCVQVDILNNPERRNIYAYVQGPVGRDWEDYHRQRAILQALPIEEHRRLTQERKFGVEPPTLYL